MENIVLSVIIPIYNEEEVLPETYKRLSVVMERFGESYELIFVNDGSRDRSPHMLADLCAQDRNVKFINFSRNFGHQPAITAGMDYARGQAVVVIDADLQDPPELILEMVGKWRDGFDVVYGKRTKRKGESLFKKITSKLFYRFLRSMTKVDIPKDTGDFRLIDRKVCDAMKALPERNRYVRGLVSWVGFKQTAVEFVREERFAGETKYPLRKMIKLAMDGITSFSYKPLKFATGLGFVFAIVSFIYLVVVIFLALFTDRTVSGWASSMVIQLFSTGTILIVLGIIGEYIGRIFDEIKDRPTYIVRETIGFEEKKQAEEKEKAE